jgi:uncharacterized membrane protein|tara:strand:- start:74 stop:334 length:261 start_codon:yes stop_codon:yes gene_type:complete
MIAFVIKLLIAHVIGDFVLQPNSWVVAKKSKMYKSKYFYLHGLVHLIALMVLLRNDKSYWLSIGIIVVSHLIIDLIKGSFEEKNES